jgi:exopolysaccharide biosynthesis polyprenyl glycosylphosphotransferase
LAAVPDPVTPRRPEIVTLASGARPQEQRRAIGTLWLLASIALDGTLLLFVLHQFIKLPTHGAKAAALVYLGTSILLLLPTYRRGRNVRRPSEVVTQVAVRLALTPMITAILTLTSSSRLLSAFHTSAYAAVVGVSILAVMLGRLFMFKVIHMLRNRGYDLEDTLIVGAGPIGVSVAAALKDNPDFGLLPCGFVDRVDEKLPYPLVGRPESLVDILAETKVRHVVLAFGKTPEEELVAEIRKCSMLRVQFYSVPRFFELGMSAGDVGHEVDGFALVPLRRPGDGHSMWPLKRAIDLCVAAFLVLLTSPVMAMCAVLVKLSSPGPVLFKQMRVGVNGVPFEMYKFRSMRVNDDHHTTWSVDDDHRVTGIGQMLRKTHLDELPQLLNVVRGEMSIVGPRPERPYFVEQFSTEIEGYHDRHRMPAGITGWAQVNGYWGDTSIEARVRLDNRYIENWSPWRDLIIALRTIPTLLGRRR